MTIQIFRKRYIACYAVKDEKPETVIINCKNVKIDGKTIKVNGQDGQIEIRMDNYNYAYEITE